MVYASDTESTVKLDYPQPDIAVIAINRPQAMNALNNQVLAELQEVLHVLEQHQQLQCVIITGAGNKAFVAGADIVAMQHMDAAALQTYIELGHHTMFRIERLPVPTLAAVNGFALGGGCELVLACDLVYAAAHAKFGLPEINLGIMPGFGGTVRLPRKIGLSHAYAWMLNGTTHDAQTAHKLGLVQEVVTDDLLTTVLERAKHIASRSKLALRSIKQACVHHQQTTVNDAAHFEIQRFLALFQTTDAQEGLQAFVEKRPAKFNQEP